MSIEEQDHVTVAAATNTTTTRGSTRLWLPLHYRNYRLLLTGQIVSALGDACLAVALPILLLGLNGVAALGNFWGAYGIARLVATPLGGMLSDRVRPRRAMLGADSVRALLVGAIALFAFTNTLTAERFTVMAILLGGAAGIFSPASMALLPDLLPTEALGPGNALSGIAIPLAALIGPALAGILLTHVDPAVAVLLDGASFIGSALALLGMRTQPRPAPSTAPAAPPMSFWRFVRTSRLLQVTLVVVLISNVVDGGLEQVALPALILGPYHGDAGTYGWLLSASGLGLLLGALCGGLMRPTARRGLVAVLLLGGDAVGMACIPYVGSLVGVAGALALWGLANGMRDVLYFTVIQEYLPSHLMGRMVGVLLFVTYGFFPLSVFTMRYAIAQIGLTLVFPAGAAIMLLAMLVGASQKVIRQA